MRRISGLKWALAAGLFLVSSQAALGQRVFSGQVQSSTSGGLPGGVTVQPPSGNPGPVSGPTSNNYGFPQPTVQAPSSWSNPLAGAAQAVQNVFAPQQPLRDQLPVGDATSLRTAIPTINSNVHLQAARLASNSGRVDEAKKQYEAVLALEPTNVEALISLARIADMREGLNAAGKIYIQALNAHPTNGAVHNDFGMSAARHERPDIALSAFQEAVRLAPKKVLYRNNLAKALLRAGRPQEALTHLVKAHPPATAHYNFAYLLHENASPSEQVLFHLRQSLRLDPQFLPAQQMFEKVAGGQRVLQQTAEFEARRAAGLRGQGNQPPTGMRVRPLERGPQQYNNQFVTPPRADQARAPQGNARRPAYTASRFPASRPRINSGPPSAAEDRSLFRAPQSRGPVYLPPAAPGRGW